LKKVLDERLVKYFPYLEEFYKILIYKIIDRGYHNNELYKDKQKLNEYICDYLKYLRFHGTYNKEQLYSFIESYEIEVIKETGRILCSLKNKEDIKTELSS
jgi:hemerythrin superfamily protein